MCLAWRLLARHPTCQFPGVAVPAHAPLGVSGWLLATAQQLSRKGLWGGGWGQVRVATGDLRSSLSSLSWEHPAPPPTPAWFVTRGLGPLLLSGTLQPPGGCGLALGRCWRACQQGRDESRSSAWPLRHRLLLPAKGRRFSLVLDWLCGFYKSSSFILFQVLVFQQGESPGRELSTEGLQLSSAGPWGGWKWPRG